MSLKQKKQILWRIKIGSFSYLLTNVLKEECV